MRLTTFILATIVALITLGSYTSDASAADTVDGLNPYIRATMWLGYTKTDADSSTTGEAETEYTQDNNISGSAVFGMKGTTNNVTAHVELGFRQYGNSQVVHRRILAASTKVGGVGILAGYSPQPWHGLNLNNVVDGEVMGADGASFEGYPMMFKVDVSGLYAALVRPRTELNSGYTIKNGITSFEDVDSTVPKVALGYTMGNMLGSPLAFGINGVYQTVKYTETTVVNIDQASLNSWLANINFAANAGPVRFQVHGFYGVNTGNMGIYAGGVPSSAPFLASTCNNYAQINAAGDGFDDTKHFGGNAGVSIKAGSGKINLGMGFEQSDNDQFTDPDQSMVYFANYVIMLQSLGGPRGFSIAPAFQLRDGKNNSAGAPQGKTMKFGISVQGWI